MLIGTTTVFEVDGELSAGDVKDVVKRYYAELRPPHIIWDFSPGGSMLKLTKEEFKEVAAAAKKVLGSGERRVAFVGPTEVTFAILCMYTAIATIEEVPAEYSAFRTLDEALRWMGGVAGSSA